MVNSPPRKYRYLDIDDPRANSLLEASPTLFQYNDAKMNIKSNDEIEYNSTAALMGTGGSNSHSANINNEASHKLSFKSEDMKQDY